MAQLIIEGKCLTLAAGELNRSPVLQQQVRATAGAIHVPLTLQHLRLWQFFYTLEDPCPAALAIVMQVLPRSLLLRSCVSRRASDLLMHAAQCQCHHISGIFALVVIVEVVLPERVQCSLCKGHRTTHGRRGQQNVRLRARSCAHLPPRHSLHHH